MHPPFEAHVFARGGRAFNMGKRSKLATFQKWPDRLADWMKDNDLLTPPKPTARSANPTK
jgi:hypothetical protein